MARDAEYSCKLCRMKELLVHMNFTAQLCGLQGELYVITSDDNIYAMPCGDLCQGICLPQAVEVPVFEVRFLDVRKFPPIDLYTLARSSFHGTRCDRCFTIYEYVMSLPTGITNFHRCLCCGPIKYLTSILIHILLSPSDAMVTIPEIGLSHSRCHLHAMRIRRQ